MQQAIRDSGAGAGGIYTHSYPVPTRQAGHGVDDVSLVKPLPCTEQFGKRGRVDHWQSAVPPPLSEATRGPWHEMSNGLSNVATFPPKRQMTEEKIIMKAIVVDELPNELRIVFVACVVDGMTPGQFAELFALTSER
jgi:hypothetical protein